MGFIFLASWFLLPWVEILFRTRHLRLPTRYPLQPLSLSHSQWTPQLEQLSRSIHDAGFTLQGDWGWRFAQQRHCYRLFYQAATRTEAALCLVQLESFSFYYFSITTRTEAGTIYRTWNYPMSYSLLMGPDMHLQRISKPVSFSQLQTQHHLFLQQVTRQREVDFMALEGEVDCEKWVQEELEAQVRYNMKCGMIRAIGDEHFCYTRKGFVFLWIQFVRDMLRTL